MARLLDRASTQDLPDSDSQARARWAWLAGQKDRSIEILKPLFTTSEDLQRQVEAIRWLGETAEPRGVELLEPIAAGGSWELAAEARLALANIDPAQHGLTSDQTKLLKQWWGFKETGEHFQQRMAGLAKLDAKEVRPLVMQMLRDNRHSSTDAALLILAAWKDKEALPQIRELMQEKRSYLRRQAVTAYLSIDSGQQARNDVIDLLPGSGELETLDVLRGIVEAAIPADRMVAMLRAAGYKPATPWVVPYALGNQTQHVSDLLVPLMAQETHVLPLARYCGVLVASDKEKQFGDQVRRAMRLLCEEPTVVAGGEQIDTRLFSAGQEILGAVAAYHLTDLAPEVQKLIGSKNAVILRRCPSGRSTVRRSPAP